MLSFTELISTCFQLVSFGFQFVCIGAAFHFWHSRETAIALVVVQAKLAEHQKHEQTKLKLERATTELANKAAKENAELAKVKEDIRNLQAQLHELLDGRPGRSNSHDDEKSPPPTTGTVRVGRGTGNTGTRRLQDSCGSKSTTNSTDSGLESIKQGLFNSEPRNNNKNDTNTGNGLDDGNENDSEIDCDTPL